MILRQLRRVVLVALALALAAGGQTVSVWTQHNSNTRIGNNNSETKLTPSNVNKNTFGKLFSYTLDDQSYSQPLYIPQLKMAVDGQIHNVVFVTTVRNSVYAWDADSNTANGGKPLWQVNLTPAGATVPNRAYYSSLGACGGNYNDFAGNLGMVGTPVIDTTTNTLYVVSHVLQGTTNVQQLHALDITSGQEKFGAPKTIQATYQGTNFDPQLNNQRPALALVNGIVYIGWSSYCDFQSFGRTYHGWVIGYRASDLTLVAAWNTTAPNAGVQGGLWQSGQGVMTDASNNVYIQTGNGTWNNNADYSMSTVKLTPALGVSSFFTPCNYQYLNGKDLDLGSSGAIPIPGTPYIAGGGKEGMFYLLDSSSMGGMSCPDKILQEFQAVCPSPATATMHIHGSPVYFRTSSDEYVYLWGENDFLRVYEFLRSPSAHFDSTAVAASTMRAPQILDSSTAITGGMSGGFMSISSNGTSNGIVWALAVYACNANQHVEPGILYAFDASQFQPQQPQSTKALTELWDSKQNVTRDDVGYYAKFTYPTIANGRVYVASWGQVPSSQLFQCAPSGVPSNQGQLIVYGLL